MTLISFCSTELSISGVLFEVGPTEEKVSYFANIVIITSAGTRMNFTKYGRLTLMNIICYSQRVILCCMFSLAFIKLLQSSFSYHSILSSCTIISKLFNYYTKPLL